MSDRSRLETLEARMGEIEDGAPVAHEFEFSDIESEIESILDGVFFSH